MEEIKVFWMIAFYLWLFLGSFVLYRHLVSEGWFDRRGLFGGLDELGRYELAAAVFTLIVAFIPFFAFGELGRAIGKQRLAAFFFSSRPGEQSVEA